MDAELSRPDLLATVQSDRTQASMYAGLNYDGREGPPRAYLSLIICNAMLGCDARCQDPGIAHRASRIAS